MNSSGEAVEQVAPGAGAVVMGTGIVSVGLATDGQAVLSRVLLVLACVAWAALLALACYRLAFRRRRFLAEALSPSGLTGVAGTAVLGSRFAQLGWPAVAGGMLILAAGAGAILLPAVVRHLPPRGTGQLLMVVVTTEAIGALLASPAVEDRGAWLAYPGLALLGAGLVAYPLVVARIPLVELTTGLGDQWILGGALAVSSLAAADLADATARVAALAGGETFVSDLSLGIWIAAALWIGPLLAGEILHLRPGYRTARWATVFPLGMYAVSAFSVAGACGAGGLADFARVWIWAAVAAWGLTTLGLLRSAWRRLGPRAAGVRRGHGLQRS